MADSTDDRLAEALYAHRNHLPEWPLGPQFSEAPADIREAYRRLAAQMAKRVDREGETDRLRAELADYKKRLNRAMQDEARITHEWDQARMAIESIGRVLDGGGTS